LLAFGDSLLLQKSYGVNFLLKGVSKLAARPTGALFEWGSNEHTLRLKTGVVPSRISPDNHP
jgi:hypothetical protein